MYRLAVCFFVSDVHVLYEFCCVFGLWLFKYTDISITDVQGKVGGKNGYSGKSEGKTREFSDDLPPTNISLVAEGRE